MSKFKVNINPFNHGTRIGKISKQPQYINKPGQKYQVFKVEILAPRNYLNHDPKTGKPVRKADRLTGSCYITDKQAQFYQDKFTVGTWVVLRGETRSVTYLNKDGVTIHAHPFNLEDIERYKVPHTDKYVLTDYDRNCLTYAIRGMDWMLNHPGLVRRYAKQPYRWLMAHDAFVPTKVNDPHKQK